MNWDDYAINIQLDCGGKTFVVDRAYELLGCEASAYTLNTQPNAQLDGATMINNNIEPRDISISAICDEKTRDFIGRFFNPKKDIKVTIKYENVTRWISGRVTEFNFIRNHVNNRNAFTVVITCADPFFRDMDDFGKNIANIVKQFAFPFISPLSAHQYTEVTQNWIKGHISGYRQFNTKLTLENRGDVEAGAIFRIEAKDAVSNPKIIHNDSEYIRLRLTLKKGDVLTINTNRGEKRIELNGENAFRYIDRNSELFQLQTGANEIEYDADAGYMNMGVYIYYTPRYLGI